MSLVNLIPYVNPTQKKNKKETVDYRSCSLVAL